jgi:hypothetical protein
VIDFSFGRITISSVLNNSSYLLEQLINLGYKIFLVAAIIISDFFNALQEFFESLDMSIIGGIDILNGNLI